MTSRLAYVVQDDLDAAWPWVEPFLTAGCSHHPTPWTAARILDEAREGRMRVWVIGDPPTAAFATRERAMGGETVCEVVVLGGERMRDWLVPCLAELEELAARNGCGRMLVEGRPGWEKVMPGYRKMAVKLEKQLHVQQ